MGRSRGNFQSEEDPTQRSRRRKHASNGENIESSSSVQVTAEGKKALYHCNYCKKDITGRTRIKCAVCSDFDLCIECFSVGAEVHPHKSNHHYRVMDVLSFPLICPDWKADEEMLLLEGLEMYGIWNWAEVGEHVGTKSKETCIEHFRTAYLNSPYFPLPDMTHVMGKNRKELLAMVKGQNEDKRGLSSLGEVTPKVESPFSPSRVKIEDQYKTGPSGRLLSAANAGPTAKKKASKKVHVKDQQDSMKPKGKSIDNSKPKSPSKDEGPSLMELSGYNEKRQEFDPEYDNDAEQLLADMEFKETDTEEERELKLRVLHIYYKRLDERQRRKNFILDRNLLYQSAFEKDLSQEEKTLCRRYDVFMRFHSKEEHEALLKAMITEHRILKRIQELKEAQAAGFHYSTEADRYLDCKRKKETAEVNGCDDGGRNSVGFLSVPVSSSDNSIDTYSINLDVVAFSDGDYLLSAPEKQLCREIRLAPSQYQKMLEIMSMHIFNGNITKRSDAYSFFKIEPTKVDRVYDMVVKKGIAGPL
ncbi:OLC1v1021130C1 [Oldenlandia corymbosa var. corymbosa]|uniref:Transcriptional adapter n=1 Tax=Oldenlandia corymbosa var. corymbosa TaxID=529605 RepID=A0AAV1BUZ3_OLDCO|nr:OLC1v1021130C1 [Oldenlandia corymbosa var. corymbosa]